MTEKEKTLIAGCLRGEKAAWDSFVLQYSGLVYHTIKKTFSLYHTEPASDQIEDLYQEFFLSVIRDDFKKLRQFKGDKGCTLASWLRLVAARMTIDFLRKQSPAAIEVDQSLRSTQPAIDASLIELDHERSLAAAVEALSSRDRLLVELHFTRGLPVEEVASILQISTGAFYTQKSRIMGKLRQVLKAPG